MPYPRKRNIMLALVLKSPKKRSFCMSNGGYYLQRVTLSDGREACFREYLDGSTETVPIKPVTLAMLGLRRLSSGRIVSKNQKED